MRVEIPSKSNLAEIVLLYGAKLNSSGDLLCDGFSYKNNKYIPSYMLPFGRSEMDFNNSKIIVEYIEEGASVGTYSAAEKFTKLFVEGDNKLIIDNFLEEARKNINKKSKNEIIIKILRNSSWYTLSKLPQRDFNTIYLPKKLKDDIKSDIEKFLSRKDLYSELGIPWKRNYLLYGPPGTGKSSFIFTVGSFLDRNIYMLSFGPKVDDTVFMAAISNLPANSILVLEDIDSLFVNRKMNDNHSMVSFSAILNVLDGMSRKNGLITFITTNYKNRLDSALLRPGRIDLSLKFDYAEKPEIKLMFKRFFKDNENNNEIWEKLEKKLGYDKTTMSSYQQFFLEFIDNMKEIPNNIKRLKEIIKQNGPDENETIKNMYS